MLTLYSTSACHLCELALAILEHQQSESRELYFEVIDISEDDALFERYGLRIPVVRDPQGREIEWPFTQAEFGLWLRAAGA
tara:strand:+ start:211147 stop:211389 length:243 start_codon:yes stop_codon:yes gene_type:complete